MIETLGTLAERIIRDLSGGDIPSDSPYKFEFVIEHVRDAMAEDLKLEMIQRRGQGGKEDDRSPVTQFIATYPDVAVKVETLTGRSYIDLPTAYPSLKFNKGIYWISKMQSMKPFIPVAYPSVVLQLSHGDFERDNWGYYAEGLKVFFLRDMTKDEIKKVLLKLIVPAADTLGPDDPLPLLPENVGRIMDTVKQRIQNRALQDRLNDNNPNLRATNV